VARHLRNYTEYSTGPASQEWFLSSSPRPARRWDSCTHNNLTLIPLGVPQIPDARTRSTEDQWQLCTMQPNISTSQHFQCTLLTILSILLYVNYTCVSNIFNCAVRQRGNCRYFNCKDLGKCELSQTGTLDCFLYVISYDLWCPLMMVSWPSKHVGVILIQIYNCKQCAYLLVYLNNCKVCTMKTIFKKRDTFLQIKVWSIPSLNFLKPADAVQSVYSDFVTWHPHLTRQHSKTMDTTENTRRINQTEKRRRFHFWT
jgi:hypothetical protein